MSTANLLYSSLAESDIRLLTITSIEPEIVCTLSTHPREDVKATYTALSYEWKRAPPSKQIFVNSQRFHVRATLYEALRQLYTRLLCEDQKAIWTDAICLNQDDDEEKTLHVPLMGEIYTYATQVLAFLGAACCNSDLAMATIASIGDKWSGFKSSGEHDKLNTVVLPPANHLVWEALSYLLRRGWFARLWIWQEAVLAKRLYLGCGEQWVSFDQMTDFIKLVQLRGRTNRVVPDLENRKNEGIFFTWNILTAHRNRYQIAGTLGLSVPALLQFFRSRECGLPVDRLWGSRALWEKNLAEVSEAWVDYTAEGVRDYWKTYIKFAKFYVSWDPTLLLLSIAASKGKHPNVPSWCPDWNTQMEYVNFGPVAWFSTGFDSSHKRNQRPSITVFDDSDIIKILGVRVDMIKEVVEGSYPDTVTAKDTEAAFRSILSWEQQCLQLSQSTYGFSSGHDQVPTQHWRTLIADGLDSRTIHNTEDLSLDHRHWKEYLQTQLSGDFKEALKGEELASRQRYIIATRDSCLGRKYFSTIGGRVGLGPPGIQNGDIICAFDYGASLYILRIGDEEKDAVLIGDAYVCDLMTKADVEKHKLAATEAFSVG